MLHMDRTTSQSKADHPRIYALSNAASIPGQNLDSGDSNFDATSLLSWYLFYTGPIQFNHQQYTVEFVIQGLLCCSLWL